MSTRTLQTFFLSLMFLFEKKGTNFYKNKLCIIKKRFLTNDTLGLNSLLMLGCPGSYQQ